MPMLKTGEAVRGFKIMWFNLNEQRVRLTPIININIDINMILKSKRISGSTSGRRIACLLSITQF